MVVTSDWHLGKVQDTVEIDGIPSRLYDTRARLKEAVGYAAKRKESLVVAGDIFDTTSPSPLSISVFFEILEDAFHKDVQVFLIPGNHDCGVKYHSAEFMRVMDGSGYPNVTMITSPCTLTVDGRRTFFLPHVPKSVVETKGYLKWVVDMIPPEDTKKLDVVIGHAHLTGAVNGSDVELEAGDAVAFNPTKFFKYTLGVFGHIHRHQVLGKNVYCGPVCTNSFDEAKVRKGFIHVDKKLEAQFVPYATPETEYKEVKIDLINKDAVSYDPVRMEAVAKGKLLKLVVFARDMMQVDQTEIKKMFDSYGTVVRFEIVLRDKYSGKVDDTDIDDVFASIDYKKVFEDWMVSKKETPRAQRELAIKLGTSVIDEVLRSANSKE